MNERIKKVESHIRKHSTTYIVGGTCLAVGVLGGLYFSRSPELVNVRPIQALTYKSTQTIEVFIEALGDPGNVIQDLETGTIYASQSQAAKELGINPGRISDHLAGRTPHVKGHTFTKLGKAMVPEA